MSTLTDWMDKCHELEKKLKHERANRRDQVRRKREQEKILKAEIERLKQWNLERAGQFACTEQRLATEIAMLKERLAEESTTEQLEGIDSLIAKAMREELHKKSS